METMTTTKTNPAEPERARTTHTTQRSYLVPDFDVRAVAFEEYEKHITTDGRAIMSFEDFIGDKRPANAAPLGRTLIAFTEDEYRKGVEVRCLESNLIGTVKRLKETVDDGTHRVKTLSNYMLLMVRDRMRAIGITSQSFDGHVDGVVRERSPRAALPLARMFASVFGGPVDASME